MRLALKSKSLVFQNTCIFHKIALTQTSRDLTKFQICTLKFIETKFYCIVFLTVSILIIKILSISTIIPQYTPSKLTSFGVSWSKYDVHVDITNDMSLLKLSYEDFQQFLVPPEGCLRQHFGKLFANSFTHCPEVTIEILLLESPSRHSHTCDITSYVCKT